MFSKSPQDQYVAEGAVAIQFGGSADSITVNQTTNTGLTLDEVRTAVQDTFKANAYQLLGQAGDIASGRAQKLLDDFLVKLEKENPAGLEQANDPGFMSAILTAQKSHAIAGDENLEKLLVSLLVERSREKKRNLQQIVLSEALNVVARLTDGQVAALTISFLLRQTLTNGVKDFNDFINIMEQRLAPHVTEGKLSDSSFSHLAFTGGGVVEMTEVKLAALFLHAYGGMFQAGFPEDDPVVLQLSIAGRRLLRPSVHGEGKLEVIDPSGNSGAILRKQVVLDPAQHDLIDQLLTRPKLTPEQVRERCIGTRPYMAALFELWDETKMKNFTASSVGIAIAHSNLCRTDPKFGSLSIWVK